MVNAEYSRNVSKTSYVPCQFRASGMQMLRQSQKQERFIREKGKDRRRKRESRGFCCRSDTRDGRQRRKGKTVQI